MDNVELALILRNTEKASRDAEAALEATERLVMAVGSRFDSFEGRLFGLESRMTGLERRTAVIERGMDSVARSNHRIEQALMDIAARLPA